MKPSSPQDRERAMQQELQESEARLRAIVGCALDAIVTIDADDRIIEFNPAAEALFGWKREEVLGFDMAETLVPARLRAGHRAGLKRHLGGAPAGRLNTRLELPAVHADGTEFLIELAVARLAGEPAHFTAFIRDLSARRAAEAEAARAQLALQESERRLASLLRNLPGMAYRCRNTPEWPMEFVSEGALALTGYTPGELVAGTPTYDDVTHPDDRLRVWETVQTGIAESRTFQVTYRIITRGGHEKWVWEQGAAVAFAHGEPAAIEGLVLDVTERRVAEEEIARLNQELEQRVRERTQQLESANAELEAFSYSIAHDLRSPLTSIDGFSHVLAGYADSLDAPARHYLQRIRTGVRQMSELTDALLALSHLSRVNLRSEPVDLAEAARATLAQLQEQEPDRAVDAQIAARIPAHGDPRLLAQVMANLVGNAWKFSAHKPRTVLHVGSQPGPSGEMVYFVADEGAGFDMAHASRLFGAFQRLHTATEFEGTGIGLALVQKIVMRHGGAVWAQAQPGQGATFYFTLGGPAG